MSKKILLIEGDPQSRGEFTTALRDKGFEVNTAKDGPTGVKVLKTLKPDVVISNLVLGEMTAVDVCEKIRSLPDGHLIGLILVSNSPRSAKYIEGVSQKYRLTDFLQKPFSPAKLLKVVDEFVQKGVPAPELPVNDDNPGAAKKSPAGGERQKKAVPKFVPGILLYYCKKSPVTGALKLRKENQEKIIFFDGGKIVGVESNLKSEQMGKVLVEKGVILEQDYLKAAQLMVEEGIQLGEALVKLKSITQEVLDEMVSEHQISKVASSFVWFDAHTSFEAHRTLPPVKNYGPISIDEIFHRGLELLKKVSHLGNVLVPIMDKYMEISPDFEQNRDLFVFPEDVFRNLEKCRAGYKLEEVLDSHLEIYLALFYLSDMLVPTTPSIESLSQRIANLKAGDGSVVDELKKQIDEANKKLSDLSLKKSSPSEQEKKLSDDLQKLKKELKTAQEELKKKKAPVEAAAELEEERRKSKELQETVARLAEEMRQLKTKGTGAPAAAKSPKVSEMTPDGMPSDDAVTDFFDAGVSIPEADALDATTLMSPAEAASEQGGMFNLEGLELAPGESDLPALDSTVVMAPLQGGSKDETPPFGKFPGGALDMDFGGAEENSSRGIEAEALHEVAPLDPLEADAFMSPAETLSDPLFQAMAAAAAAAPPEVPAEETDIFAMADGDAPLMPELGGGPPGLAGGAPGFSGLESLEGASEENLDATMVFQSPPVGKPAPTPPPAGDNLDRDLNLAFEHMESPQDAGEAGDPGSPETVVPPLEAADLPVDPFAPPGSTPPPSPPEAAPADEFEDYFSSTKT